MPRLAARPLRPSRLVVTLTLLAAASSLPACDAALTVRNAAPRVTWVVVQPPAAEEPAHLTVWVSDLDGDPVDLALTVRGADGADVALTLAPGGHGVIGLATREGLGDPNGQPHLVLWDTTQAPAGPLVLTITPTDAQGDAGATVATPPFTLDAGLPDPVTPAPLASP